MSAMFRRVQLAMTPIARALGGTKYNRSNFVITVLVLLLVVALFFIPELVDFQKALTKQPIATTTPKIATVVKDKAIPSTEVSRPPESSVSSSLAQIVSLIDGGIIDKLRAQRSAAKSAPQGGGVTDGKEQIVVGPKSDEIKAGEMLSKENITWNDIQNPMTSRFLFSARDDALRIAKAMPEQKAASRFALFNFAAGIARLVDRSGDFRSAGEGVRYLRYLDENVTAAMIREGVDRGVFLQWREVSVGPVIEKGSRTKQGLQIAFDPKLVLLSAKVFQPGYGAKFVEDGIVGLHFTVGVMGSDIQKVTLYENGRALYDAAPGVADERGFRRINFKFLNGRSSFTVRVYDKFGSMYEKSYSFYPRVRRFSWTPADNGAYLLPFKTAAGNYDPNLDRYFRSHSGRIGFQTVNARGFETF